MSFMFTEFKFYTLNSAGLVDSASSIKLADDDAALAYAKAKAEVGMVEVWSGSRRVAVVPPQPGAARSAATTLPRDGYRGASVASGLRRQLP